MPPLCMRKGSSLAAIALHVAVCFQNGLLGGGLTAYVFGFLLTRHTIGHVVATDVR